MKKIYALLIVLSLFLSSCSLGGLNMHVFDNDDNSIANNTFLQIVNTIKSEDQVELKTLFSEKVCNEISNFDVNIVDFLDFIQGQITSFDDAAEAGISADSAVEHGKKRKQVQSSFGLQTNEEKYYIAIQECTEDTFDASNVGIKSIYIINAKDWKQDYVYRGDGKWISGINIIK